jgi:Protein of unknown function (DUF3237)
MPLELVPLGILTLTMGDTHTLPGGPAGTRVIVELPRVEWRGDRLRARLKGRAAADWIAIGPEGTAVLDMRFTLETEDGALVYVQAHGRSDSAAFANGGPTYIAPVFETGDARYAWLNRVQAVGRGRLEAGAVTLEVYEAR